MSDTPIQRLVKSEPYLDSMKDRDYIGDAEHGGMAAGAGYLIARRKGLHRWHAKILGLAAGGAVIGISHAYHNHIVDRAVPHYDMTKAYDESKHRRDQRGEFAAGGKLNPKSALIGAGVGLVGGLAGSELHNIIRGQAND